MFISRFLYGEKKKMFQVHREGVTQIVEICRVFLENWVSPSQGPWVSKNLYVHKKRTRRSFKKILHKEKIIRGKFWTKKEAQGGGEKTLSLDETFVTSRS